MKEVVMLVKKPNATSIVWNIFGLKANEQGTPKPGKDQTSVCQSCKKGTCILVLHRLIGSQLETVDYWEIL